MTFKLEQEGYSFSDNNIFTEDIAVDDDGSINRSLRYVGTPSADSSPLLIQIDLKELKSTDQGKEITMTATSDEPGEGALIKDIEFIGVDYDLGVVDEIVWQKTIGDLEDTLTTQTLAPTEKTTTIKEEKLSFAQQEAKKEVTTITKTEKKESG